MVQSLGGAGATTTDLDNRNLTLTRLDSLLRLGSGQGTLTERQARVSQAESINTDIIPASNVFWEQYLIRESAPGSDAINVSSYDGTNVSAPINIFTATNSRNISFAVTRYLRVASAATVGTYIWHRHGYSFGSGSKLEKVYDLYKKYQEERNLILSCWYEVAKDGKVIEVKLLQDNEIDFDVNRIVQSVSLDEAQFEVDIKTGIQKKVANTLDEHIKANLQRWKAYADKKQVGTLCGFSQNGDREDVIDIGRKEWNKIAKEIGVALL